MGNKPGTDSPSGTSTPGAIPAGGLAGRGGGLGNYILPKAEKHPDPRQRPNYLFYTNQIECKPDGALIDDIHEHWKFSFRLLEEHHGYIQWLFPVFESAGMSFDSEALTKEEAVLLKQDFQACCRFIKSYKLQLNFYGVILTNLKTGELARNPKNWQKRYNNFYKHPHNNLRMSRIIISLGEFGFAHYKKHLLAHWKREIEEFGYLQGCKKSLQDFWEPLLNHDSPAYAKKTHEEPADREPCILVKHIEENTEQWKAVEDELTEYLIVSEYPNNDEISDFTFSDNISSEDPNIIPYHDHGPNYVPCAHNIDDILSNPHKYIAQLEASRSNNPTLSGTYTGSGSESTSKSKKEETNEGFDSPKIKTPPVEPFDSHHKHHLPHLPHPHLPHHLPPNPVTAVIKTMHSHSGKDQPKTVATKDDFHTSSQKHVKLDSPAIVRAKSARLSSKGSSKNSSDSNDSKPSTPKSRRSKDPNLSQSNSQVGTPESLRKAKSSDRQKNSKGKKSPDRISANLEHDHLPVPQMLEPVKLSDSKIKTKKVKSTNDLPTLIESDSSTDRSSTNVTPKPERSMVVSTDIKKSKKHKISSSQDHKSSEHHKGSDSTSVSPKPPPIHLVHSGETPKPKVRDFLTSGHPSPSPSHHHSSHGHSPKSSRASSEQRHHDHHDHHDHHEHTSSGHHDRHHEHTSSGHHTPSSHHGSAHHTPSSHHHDRHVSSGGHHSRASADSHSAEKSPPHKNETNTPDIS